MKIENIIVSKEILDFVLGNIGLSYNVAKCKESTIISLANKSKRSEAKFMRMIPIHFKITAPLAFYVEADTYKIGTVRWSNSVMHSVLKNGVTMDDFETDDPMQQFTAKFCHDTIEVIREYHNNGNINKNEAKLLIKSAITGNFLYTSIISMNYEVLRNIYQDRINHELSWWQEFLIAFEGIPYYNEFIKGDVK